MNKIITKTSKLLIFLMLIVLLTLSCSCNQDLQQVNDVYTELYNDSINADEIEKTIKELTLEKYQGRLTGTEGNELAIEYIINEFKKAGLKNPEGLENYRQQYNQEVRIVNKVPKLELLDKKGNVIKEYKYIDDFTIVTNRADTRINGDIIAPVYAKDELRYFKPEEVKDRFGIMTEKIYNEYPTYTSFIKETVDYSVRLGAHGVIVERALNTKQYPYNKYPVVPSVYDNTTVNNKGPMIYFVSTLIYSEIKEETGKGALVHAFIDCSIEEVQTSNVIGYIPGSDKELKNEYIILSAHLDHAGSNGDGTYNPGGLDNSSGISCILEVAKTIQEKNIKPKKSIVFVAFNGEEEGKIGSQNYVKEPVFPLDKSLVINLDMVGSKKMLPLTIESNDKEETDLRDEFVKFSNEMGIYNKAAVGNRSDHASFYTADVPAISLINYDWNGYHTPYDTIDNVDITRVKKVGELILYYLAHHAY